MEFTDDRKIRYLAFRSGLILLDRQTGPDGEIAWIIQLGWPGYLMHLFLLLGCLGSLIALERTFRASVGTMRWKIKYMLFGLGLLFAVRFFTSSQAILFQSLDVSLEALNSAALLFACLLISRSMARPGSFDLNLYPSQSVLSNSLTIILAGLYLTIVGILSKLVEWFGAEGSFALKAFFILAAIVVLGIGLQSDRLRRKVRTFVSQHFQRPLYDYQKVWLRFSEGLSAHVESEPLCRTIVSLVSETFQALSVSAWIPASAENKARLAASTIAKSMEPLSSISAAAARISALRKLP